MSGIVYWHVVVVLPCMISVYTESSTDQLINVLLVWQSSEDFVEWMVDNQFKCDDTDKSDKPGTYCDKLGTYCDKLGTYCQQIKQDKLGTWCRQGNQTLGTDRHLVQLYQTIQTRHLMQIDHTKKPGIWCRQIKQNKPGIWYRQIKQDKPGIWYRQIKQDKRGI